MVILIDILHPAHVHFFRHIINNLKAGSHTIIVSARQKEMSVELLREYSIPYTLVSQQEKGFGLILEMITRTIRLILLCLRHQPKLLMGIMGPSIAVSGFILRIPAWVFYDTENAWITNWFAYPLAHRVYTPVCYQGNFGKNQIRYAGYHELAYLHPQIFTPDRSVLEKYKLDLAKPYTLVRFVSWKASHDIGEKGIPFDDKMKLVSTLEKYGQVFITSETPLPKSLQSKHIPVTITEIHHLIAFAKLVVGESATMASEAAVLGIPAIFISDTLRGYTIEEEKKYNLVYNLSRRDIVKALDIINDICQNPQSGKKYKERRAKLLKEKINVTEYVYSEITSFTMRNA